MTKSFLVVPSIRENCFKEFMSAWHDNNRHEFHPIILVEDNPERTFKANGCMEHYSWKEIDGDLKEKGWIISRRDSAIRSYGFFKAYQMGADYIYTLDDDCFPESGENFYLDHYNKLSGSPSWDNKHITAWDGLMPGVKTRGQPYKNLGVLKNVVANVGLWTNVPDYDAVQTLGGGLKISDFRPPEPCNRILPRGQYSPICGMNLCFKREVAVLMYFALMGENSPYRRFDDIWMGIILKKVCDHLGLLISCGHPFIHHSRASDPFVNLVKEAPGIKANETFWEVVDAIVLKGSTPKDCMIEVGEALQGNTDPYLNKYGKAITIWANLF